MANTINLLAWAITPAFAVAGLALMSIPIIIHILNRRRFRIIKWAAMEYLLQAMRKNRRRVKFEQMILLATRCLLLALLGLALARPFGCADSTIAALAGQKAALHIFIIDNSYSMAHESEQSGKTHLDVAKALAKQQIERLAGGSESVAIVLAGRPARSVGPSTRPSGDARIERDLVLMEPNYDVNGAIEAVGRIEQSYYSTDIVGALQAAIQIAKDDKKQPQKLLYILSDCTRSGWDTAQSAEMFKQIGQGLKSTFGRNIRLNNLGRADQWNYAVLSVRPDGGLVTPTFHTDFLADVKGFGLGGDTLVQWKWDDKLLPDTSRLKPDVNTEIQKQTKVKINEGGPHVLTVSLINDGEKVKVDNTRHRVVEVASAMKILIVEGTRGAGALSGSAAFLATALSPNKMLDAAGHVRSDTYVVSEVIPDLELNNRVLGDYAAVILTSVAGLTPGQADQMEKFVSQGGSLMFFMGDQVSPDAYNTVLLPRKLLPGKLITRKTQPADTRAFHLDFNPNGTLHPVLAEFRGHEKTGLDTAQVYTYYQVELSPEVKPEVILRYVPTPDGASDPAITQHNLGKGKVVFVSSSANSEWQNLPLKPNYPSLIHELLANSVDVGDEWMNLTVGQQVQIPATLKLSGNPVLTDYLKKQIPIDPFTIEGQGTSYRSRAIDKPGLYSLNIGNRTLPIAVNVPDDEADIRVLPSPTIQKNLGDIEMEVFGPITPASALARDDSSDFGWTLMVLVLGLLCIECFMAMRFGHYRKGSAPVAVPATASLVK